MWDVVPLDAAEDGSVLLRMIPVLALFGIAGVSELLGWWAVRKHLNRLESVDSYPQQLDWELPAPECYILLCGVKARGKDAFKLGLLQLIATDALRVVESESPDGGKETLLTHGTGSHSQGCPTVIYQLWLGRPYLPTVKEIVREADKTWGSIDLFCEEVVAPELAARGLYRKEEYRRFGLFRADRFILTADGEIARSEVEARAATVLRQMRDANVPLLKQGARRTLMAAVLGAATGLDPAGTAIAPAVELETAETGPANESPGWFPAYRPSARHDAVGSCHLSLDWAIFDGLDSLFSAVDPGFDGGGDGGNGGGDSGGGE